MLRTHPFGPVTRIDVLADSAAEAGRWSACYLVDGILFDSAMRHGRDELFAAAGDRVRTVALTHCHEDHAGGASAFVRSARILAPAEHLDLLADPEELPLPRDYVWGRPEPVLGEPLPDEVVEAGRRYQVVAAPGHCPQHVAFVHREEGWVFAGDVVTATTPRYAREEEDLPALVATLRMLKALEPERLFLAHLPVPQRAADPVEALLAYLESRAAEAKGLANKGAGPEEIVERMFGGEFVWWRGPDGSGITAKQITAGDFSTENLVRGLLSL